MGIPVYSTAQRHDVLPFLQERKPIIYGKICFFKRTCAGACESDAARRTGTGTTRTGGQLLPDRRVSSCGGGHRRSLSTIRIEDERHTGNSVLAGQYGKQAKRRGRTRISVRRCAVCTAAGTRSASCRAAGRDYL